MAEVAQIAALWTLFNHPKKERESEKDGGAGYNITGLPPAWPDAVVLRGELAKAWKRSG